MMVGFRCKYVEETPIACDKLEIPPTFSDSEILGGAKDLLL